LADAHLPTVRPYLFVDDLDQSNLLANTGDNAQMI
jgi:hypothetical protein